MFDADFANLWDNTETIVSNSGSVPDGKYTCKVASVRFDKSKNEKSMICWDLIVEDGDYKGRHIFNNQFVSSAKSIGFVKGQFQKLGFDCSSFEMVHVAFEQLLDCVVDVTCKTSEAKNGYEPRQNVYINKIISKPVNETIDPELGF